MKRSIVAVLTLCALTSPSFSGAPSEMPMARADIFSIDGTKVGTATMVEV